MTTRCLITGRGLESQMVQDILKEAKQKICNRVPDVPRREFALKYLEKAQLEIDLILLSERT